MGVDSRDSMPAIECRRSRELVRGRMLMREVLRASDVPVAIVHGVLSMLLRFSLVPICRSSTSLAKLSLAVGLMTVSAV